jgi:hypothetical protein
MNRELLVGRILEDEGIRGDLTDDAAQILVEWLVGRAEAMIGNSKSESAVRKQIDALCQRGRTIAKFVSQAEVDPAGASLLAKEVHLPWPLSKPESSDPVMLMRKVLAAELNQ